MMNTDYNEKHRLHRYGNTDYTDIKTQINTDSKTQITQISAIIYVLICLILTSLVVLSGAKNLYAIEPVNEKSTSKLTMTFIDEDGALVTPSSGTYRIDDVDSGTVIKTDTNFTPAGATHSIIISSTENKILDQSKTSETRRITIIFSYSGGRTGTGDYIYKVKNLPGVL